MPGRSATTVYANTRRPCVRRPAAVLRARHAPHPRHLVESLPPDESVGWAGVPEDVRLRHAALLPGPGPGGPPGSARLTRERARHGLGGRLHYAPSTQPDGLLTAGLLDGADLVGVVLTGLGLEWNGPSTVEALLTGGTWTDHAGLPGVHRPGTTAGRLASPRAGTHGADAQAKRSTCSPPSPTRPGTAAEDGGAFVVAPGGGRDRNF
ncbi:hypothetical protein [Streptomyces sp. NPDC088760]|uniref:hypothetical protein n=1 Tax=Streptomyces sp. NPDC088760 TaxID=3365890 RepID=UPI0037FFF7A0